MNINASVEAWMAFFLIQALPTSAALVRLFLAPPENPSLRARKLIPFDGLAFLFLFLLLLLDLFVSRPSLKAEWVFLAASVAAVYALILSAEFSSHAAVERFASGILSPVPDFKWLVVSLSIFPILFAIGRLLGSLLPIFSKATLFHQPFPSGSSLKHVPLLFVTNTVFAGGIGGEPFWRGILYVRLRKRRLFLRAALMTGIAQALWFIPCGLLIGYDPEGILLIFAFFVSVSPVFAWVYERSGRSLLAAILLFGSMMTAFGFSPLSFMTVGAVILFISAALLAENKLRRIG